MLAYRYWADLKLLSGLNNNNEKIDMVPFNGTFFLHCAVV